VPRLQLCDWRNHRWLDRLEADAGGGRGRIRTGTPVSQKQILSPLDAFLPNPLCGQVFHLQCQEMPMTSIEMG